MLAGQSVHGVFHGVSRKDFAIVALDMGGGKIAFKANGNSDLADIIAALLLSDAQQMNVRTPIVVFRKANRHSWLQKKSAMIGRRDSSAVAIASERT